MLSFMLRHLFLCSLAAITFAHSLKTITIHDKITNAVYDVTYWVNSEGQAVIWGDIIWGSEDLLLSWRTSEKAQGHGRRWFGVDTARAWPDATVRYKFQNDAVKTTLGAKVRAALGEWGRLAPYLTFIEETPSEIKSADVLTITAYSEVCHSTVGYRALRGFLQMNLSLDPKLCHNRAPLHEWGHALGLFHEHQRPDRDDYLFFNCSALEPDNPCPETVDCCESTLECCDMSQFGIHEVADYQLGDFDYDSIMIYPGNSSARQGQYTFTRKDDGTPLKLTTKITAGDLEGICAIYLSACAEYYAMP